MYLENELRDWTESPVCPGEVGINTTALATVLMDNSKSSSDSAIIPPGCGALNIVISGNPLNLKCMRHRPNTLFLFRLSSDCLLKLLVFELTSH